MIANLCELLLQHFPTSSFFVEAGAHDGIGDSHTIMLERHGWSGICIEASSAFAGLEKHRRCAVSNAVLGEHDGDKVVFREVCGNAIELSGILECFREDGWDRDGRPHRDREVYTTSLQTVLIDCSAPSAMQFLALDTEGSELSILQGLDWNMFTFAVVLLEHNSSPGYRDQLKAFLHQKDYVFVDDAGPKNDVYRHRDTSWRAL